MIPQISRLFIKPKKKGPQQIARTGNLPAQMTGFSEKLDKMLSLNNDSRKFLRWHLAGKRKAHGCKWVMDAQKWFLAGSAFHSRERAEFWMTPVSLSLSHVPGEMENFLLYFSFPEHPPNPGKYHFKFFFFLPLSPRK